MAAGYVEEESQVWKCPKHPSKRNRSNGGGICPSCLRERLAGLCPDCANVRPCSCGLSSSSSSSSEPSLRRSRSVAVPIKTPSFLSILKRNKTTKKREGVVTEAKKEEEEESINSSNNRIEDFARLITRSRSVTVSVNNNNTSAKPKSWHPMKVFKTSSWLLPKFVVIHNRSPLHRA